MGRSSAIPLRRQLFLAIFALLVPLLAAVVWSGWLSLHERSNELENQAATMAQTIAAFVDRDVGELDSLGRRFAALRQGDAPPLGHEHAEPRARSFSPSPGRAMVTRIGRSLMPG